VNPDTERQQVLFVWTADSSLSSRIVGWNLHDGNDIDRDLTDAPADRGVDLLVDGWRLLQAAPLVTRAGDVHVAGVLEYEWVFERVVPRTTTRDEGDDEVFGR